MTLALAELLIGAVETIELEGLRLQGRLKKMLRSVVLMIVAGGLLLTGLVWLMWSAFTLLATVFVPAAAGLIIGSFSLLLALGCLWLARK